MNLHQPSDMEILAKGIRSRKKLESFNTHRHISLPLWLSGQRFGMWVGKSGVRQPIHKHRHIQPDVVVKWLAPRNIGQKVVGSNLISQWYVLNPGRVLPQSKNCYVPNEKAGTTQLSIIPFTGTSFRV